MPTALLAALAAVVLGGVGVLAFLFLGGDDNGSVETATSSTEADTDPDGSSTEDSPSTTDPDDPTETTGTDLDPTPPGAERLARSVVQIQLLLEGQPVCTGSGTVIDAEGTVVTNYHVIQQSPVCPHDQIGVAVAQSSQSVPDLLYAADLLVFDPDLDLAVIRVARGLDGQTATPVFEPVEVGDSDGVELGDQIRVFGFPGIGGETITFTTGSVSGFTDTPEGGERSWLKTDATIAGGNSGGLAVDEEGRFIGIPTRAGSGDGPIVDCRVIADSNGDGEQTEDDSCVPIGGFINGIRPVSLALPLIDAARTAQPIDQGPPSREQPMNPVLPVASNPQWTTAVDDTGAALDRLVAGVAGSENLCLVWSYADVAAGSEEELAWLLDGEVIPEVSNDGPSPIDAGSGEFYACISNPSGLEAGVFELAWFIDGELIFVEGILVADGASATVDVINDSDQPVCVVQFNPTDTVSYGLNELAEPLPPGQTVTLDIALGPTDARVIDCNGDVRIEDSSGFDIDGDVTLTVE